jgi:hypothetical protein
MEDFAYVLDTVGEFNSQRPSSASRVVLCVVLLRCVTLRNVVGSLSNLSRCGVDELLHYTPLGAADAAVVADFFRCEYEALDIDDEVDSQ